MLDEAHSYRGVFGAHIANLLRRLRRVCALYRTVPVFYGASATSSNPVESFSKLIGVPQRAVTAITESTSARGETTVALWEPEFMPPKAHDQLAKGAAAPAAGGPIEAEQEAPRRVSPSGAGGDKCSPTLVLSRDPLAGFRRFASQRRNPLAEDPTLPRRGGGGPFPPRRRIPRRVHPRRAPRTRTQTPQRRTARPGEHLRAGTGHRHLRTGRRTRGGLAGHPRLLHAARGPRRSKRSGRARRAHRRRQPARYLPGAPPGGDFRAGG